MNKNLVMLLCIIALWLLVIKPLNKNGGNTTNNNNNNTAKPDVDEFVDDPSTYPEYDYDSSLVTTAQNKTEKTVDLLAAGRGYTV